jgi:hypothetical protein
VDIHVPGESRGEHDNSDKLEVRREALALDDTLKRHDTESLNDNPDNNEVPDADEAPARPTEEEEEFFDLSDSDTNADNNADTEEPPLALQSPPNLVVEDADKDKEVQRV